MFTLQEALNAVKNKSEFGVYDRGTYTVIDYNIAHKDTFIGSTDEETLILQNLRGTAFDNETGEIISLPFHKFHNLNECQGYMEEDLKDHGQYSIAKKLDGSMIRVIDVPSEKLSFTLGTRAGVTDVSKMADKFLDTVAIDIKNNYVYFIEFVLSQGYTPMFEFCSLENRVVIEHQEPKMILLAIRSNRSGVYIERESLAVLAANFGISLVDRVPFEGTLTELKEDVKDWIGEEGVVVCYESGKMVKIKAADYCIRHSVAEFGKYEKDVVKVILEGKLDDMIPLLSDTMAARVQLYDAQLYKSITETATRIQSAFLELYHNSNGKREFASLVKTQPKKFHSFLFNLYDGRPLGLKEFILKHTSSGPKLEEIRGIIGPSFYDIKV